MSPIETGRAETDFEADIVAALVVSAGYVEASASDFDLQLGLDTVQLDAWIQSTQASRWAQLIKRYGGDEASAREGFRRRLNESLNGRGVIDVLRHGLTDQMLHFDLASFRPATTMNPSHAAAYAANRLTVVRQLRYSPKHTKTLDLGLFVNGVLVATAELKNPLTGQTVTDAIKQYSTDREPDNSTLRRALVHFAVDPYLAYMTTRLAKKETNFLPFNRGRDEGKGNPSTDNDYDTAYLWRTVWERDAWLDILGRFVQSTGTGASQRHLFPRYHQWDVVRRLEADARTHGAGRRYLIQHSAGSGKSNSISWLAHRLSTLHDADDRKTFDKVLVITDRRVLDEQLRANVRSFEKVPGTVVTVTGSEGSKSADLIAALDSAVAKIIVTTLQTFPFLLRHGLGDDAAQKRYAILIDEAHSSQTGGAATALRKAIGSGAELEDDVDAEEALAELLRARGRQRNLSYFAFTATPKDKTNEVFGTPQANGTKGAFHLYSMRQAIEEGFILDVLQNYTTHKTYFKLAVTSEEAGSEEYEVARASAALRRILVQDPDVIAAKARLMVEHFRLHTAKKIGGAAKAMVVTDSRASAVRYKRAIDEYVRSSGYDHLSTLVAFSGKVDDTVAGQVTESGLNGFPESQTAARFKGEAPYRPGDYQVLIVAEKYQTGFDEPLLHTMFVDKVLTGLATVQTLSRLNRSHPEKFDTFVLDFRNEAESVRKDFQRYYQATFTQPTEANALSDAYLRLTTQFDVLDETEMAQVVRTYFSGLTSSAGLGGVYAAFNPALERYGLEEPQQQGDFRSALAGFLSLYSFMSQVLPWVSAEMERTFIYGSALIKLLPTTASGALELGDEVVLTHLRVAETSAGTILLEPSSSEAGSAYPGAGQGRVSSPTVNTLAGITDELNLRFGLDLTDAHRLAFQQFELNWLGDAELRDVAKANPLSGFQLEFERKFTSTVLDAQELNADLYERLYEDDQFRRTVVNFYVGRMYDLLRETSSSLPERVIGASDESPWVAHLGPFFSHDRAVKMLEHQQLNKQTGRLPEAALALTTTSGQVVYPASQFREGESAPGLERVLALLPEALVSRWTVASWLTSGDSDLGGARPLDVLFDEGEAGLARVLDAAEAWARQLDA